MLRRLVIPFTAVPLGVGVRGIKQNIDGTPAESTKPQDNEMQKDTSSADRPQSSATTGETSGQGSGPQNETAQKGGEMT
jgi:hypothetical protein